MEGRPRRAKADRAAAAGFKVEKSNIDALREAFLKQAFDRFKLVATIEEHSLIGGFGAAVSEWLTDSRTTNQNFLRFGTPDAFFKKSGEQEYAREMLGLRAHQIAEKIIQVLH